MLKKLRTSFLLPAELSEIIKSYVKAVRKSGISHDFLNVVISLLLIDVENLKLAIQAIRLNALVKLVAQADAVRDDLFLSFRDIVDAARRRSKVFLDAHNLVFPQIEKAGNRLYQLGYMEKSGRLQALIDELKKPAYQNALLTMKVDDLFLELVEAHDNFTTLYADRLEEESKKDYPTIDEAKRKAVPHVNIFLGTVSILQEVDAANYDTLVNELNVITTEIMATARARKTRSENEALAEVPANDDFSSDAQDAADQQVNL
ncbi:MAG: DUF6261 family protein [Bacteroidota bacterium]